MIAISTNTSNMVASGLGLLSAGRWVRILMVVALFGWSLRASAQDTEAPYFTFLAADPQTVDVTNGEVTTYVEIEVVDDAAGFSSGSILVLLEGTALKWFFSGSTNRISGTPTNGRYRVPITFPPGSPSGNRPLGAILFDNAGRGSSAYSESAVITVVNNGLEDLDPPTVAGIRFDPNPVDLSGGPATVQIEIDLVDDFSGIDFFDFDLAPPLVDFVPDPWIFVYISPEPGITNVTVARQYTFSEYAPAGEWRIEIDNFFDRVNRGGEYGFKDPALYDDFDATVEIINPNQDITPPVLESVVFPQTVADTTFNAVKLPFVISFSDPGSGVESFTVQLRPPSGGKELGEYYPLELGATTGDIRNGTVEGFLDVPRFIEEGQWTVQVRLDDVVGFTSRLGYQGGDPLPPGSTTQVTIQNAAGSDVEDMEVVDFYFSPDPVDVTDSDQLIAVYVDFEDNLSGLDWISLRLETEEGDLVDSLWFDPETVVAGTLTKGTAREWVRVPRFSPPGVLVVDSLGIRDAAGNYESRISRPIFTGGIPNEIPIINNGLIDEEPPEFLGLSMPTTSIDVTDENQRLYFNVTATDDASGIEDVRLRYRNNANASDTITAFLSDNDVVDKNGNTYELEDYRFFRQFSPPGTYSLYEIEVEDFLGRVREYGESGDFPLPAGLPLSFTVINNGPVDETPPAFTSLSLSSTQFDVTDFAPLLSLNIGFMDDTSGLGNVEVRLVGQDTGRSVTLFDSDSGFGVMPPIMGTPTLGSVEVFTNVLQYIPSDTYEVIVELMDGLRRTYKIEGADADFPFVGQGLIEVINNGSVDEFAPFFKEIEVLGDADVTDLAQTVQVAVTLADDVAGVREANIWAYSPSGEELERIEFLPEDLSTGTLTDGTFVGMFEFPAFAEPGEWTFRVSVTDNVGRIDFLDELEVEAFGLTSSVTVINNQPEGYLWKGSEAYPEGWRWIEWFGWVQDPPGKYPAAWHTEHGWLYASGESLVEFYAYDYVLETWWWISEAYYPYLYASGAINGWYYYYAPYGTPGDRWFHELATGLDKREDQL